MTPDEDWIESLGAHPVVDCFEPLAPQIEALHLGPIDGQNLFVRRVSSPGCH